MDENLMEEAESIALDLLPKKSGEVYMKSYERFIQWKITKNIKEDCLSEAVMLVYFKSIQSKYKPSSLWVEYSMLRAMIARNHNIDIKYPKLIVFLKKYSVGYQPKKSKVFQAVDVNKFLTEADDLNNLLMKVIMIFGVYGATRADELTKVHVSDIREEGNIIIVKIPETKTNVVRTFTVEDQYAECIKKYMNLRPQKIDHNRFFINFQKGKCTVQPVGRNKFLNTPKQIAIFLNLDNPENYTGHSFRRTSATLLANSGADLLTLKRHGGWRSSSVVEGYIEESISNKRKISHQISNEISIKKHISTTSSTIVQSDISPETSTSTSAQPLSIVMQLDSAVEEKLDSEPQPSSIQMQLHSVPEESGMEREHTSDAVMQIESNSVPSTSTILTLSQSNTTRKIQSTTAEKFADLTSVDKLVHSTDLEKFTRGMQVNNCTNFTINFNFNK